MWWSSCPESSQKTNLLQLFCNVVGYKTRITRLYAAQGDLHEKFKESNLAKVSL